MSQLYVLQGPDKGKTFELHQGYGLIGRDSPSIVLTDVSVSRRHSELLQEDSRWLLKDLGSVNGTYLNGVKIDSPHEVRVGDQIRCGSTVLVFGSSAEPAFRAEPTEVHLGVHDDPTVDSTIMDSMPSKSDLVQVAPTAADDLRVMYQLISATNSIFDLDQLLERAMDLIFEVISAERGFILLLGEDGSTLTPKAVRTREGEDRQKIHISRTIVNHVIRNQEGVISSDASRDARFSGGKSVHAYGIRSAMCVPIRARDKILGVITLDSSVANVTYGPDQLSLLTAMGHQVGLAIENAMLYQAGVRAERLAATGETVAYLSHHIKNILQGLRGGADVVEMALKSSNTATAQKGWGIVGRNLDRIYSLTMNMLAFSKQREPHLEEVDLNALIQDVLDLIEPQARQGEVEIVHDLAENLPLLFIDTDGFHQVLLNILSNALDAVEPGKGRVELTSQFVPATNSVLVRINDNGSGIDPEELPHIFEAFHSSKGHRGTGLGLAVARKIIEEHNGHIEVESSLGSGTTFTISLPLSLQFGSPAPK
ncbi:MAG: GAF domain-containing protein [Actinobacteria bacterium]|nr:GAF domain-containing protein [Actinomycetota bacterium]